MDCNKTFYSELPSRNIYIDSIVNDLPGYYPARSEFTVEYCDNAEQRLTEICYLYDQIVNQGDNCEESDIFNGNVETKMEAVKDSDTKYEKKKKEKVDKKEVEDEVFNNGTQSLNRKRQFKSSSKHAKVRKLKDKSETKNYLNDEIKSNIECQNKEMMKNYERSNSKSSGSSFDIFAETSNRIRSKEIDNEKRSNKIINLETNDRRFNETHDDIGIKDPGFSGHDLDRKDSSVKRTKLLEELCITSIEIYNNQLKERQCRKDFVKNHGFLDQKKIYSWYNIHNLELGFPFEILFKKFIRLFDNAYEFDKFLQSLKLEKDLKNKLLIYDELRQNGIKYKNLIPIYNEMKLSRNKRKDEVSSMEIKWQVNSGSLESSTMSKLDRFKKLDICHLPMYKYLDDYERELCENIRLSPESYVNFKKIIIEECKKLDGLKLAQARKLFKIDVNKTRKLYDFLLLKKLIWKN